MFTCSNSDSKQHTSMTTESNDQSIDKERINVFVELKRSWITLKVPYINFWEIKPYNLFWIRQIKTVIIIRILNNNQ